MGESTTHARLVEELVLWLGREVSKTPGAAIYADTPSTRRGEKPPAIGAYTPDVFCRTLGGSCVFIGEAKTADDIEPRHTREQLLTFLMYLRDHGSGTLVIAVPWHAVNQAKWLIRALQNATATASVQTVYLQKLPG